MKRFILLGLLFVALPIVLGVIALPCEWRTFKRSLRCPLATVGVIGDSHAANAIDPSAFPGLANFSQRNGGLPISIAKLGYILDENPQLKYFMIDLWPALFLTDSPISSRIETTRRYFPSLILLDIYCPEKMGGYPTHDQLRNFLGGVMGPFVMRQVTRSTHSDLNEGFVPLDGCIMSHPWYKNGCHFAIHMSKPMSRPDFAGRREVEQIISALRARGVSPVLLTTPLFAGYEDGELSAEVRRQFDAAMKDVSTRSNVPWIDCRRDMPDARFWGDMHHLNALGASEFSKKLYERFQTEVINRFK